MQDKKADLIISTYVDDILLRVCKRLGIEIPDYNPDIDPTKSIEKIMDWTISPKIIKELEKNYNNKLKIAAQQRKSGKVGSYASFCKDVKNCPTKKRKIKDESDVKSEYSD